jgi:hypothetical protein
MNNNGVNPTGKMPCYLCGKFETTAPVSIRTEAVAFLMKFRKGYSRYYCTNCFYKLLHDDNIKELPDESIN